MTNTWKKLLYIWGLALVAMFPPFARANDLDQNFGGFGTVQLNLSKHDYVQDVEVADDGKILILGSTEFDAMGKSNSLIARFLSDGSLDTSFGGLGGAPSGTAVFDTQYQWDTPGGMAILPDGRIAALRYSPSIGWAILMLTEKGALDESFGSSGKMILGFEEDDDSPRDVEMIGNKIVIWSSTRVIRLHQNGSFDPTFGNDGMVLFEDVAGEEVVVTGAAFIGNDMYFSSYKYMGFIADPGDLRLFKLNANGSKNFVFGNNGIISKPNPLGESSRSLAFKDDRLTIGLGNKVLRFDSEGVMDTTFGNNGTVNTGINADVLDIILQPYGTTTVAMDWDGNANENEIMAMRLTSEGELDLSFGNQFGFYRGVFGQYASAKKVFGYANGKVLIVGDFKLPGDGAPRNIALIRTGAWGGQDGGGGIGGGADGFGKSNPTQRPSQNLGDLKSSGK